LSGLKRRSRPSGSLRRLSLWLQSGYHHKELGLGMMMSESKPVDGAVVPVDERDLQLMLESGYLYLELQKPKDSQEIFSGVEALLPQSEVPQLALNHLHFAKGEFPKALAAAKKAVEMNPGSAAAHAAVGEALLFLKRIPEGRESLKRAISLEPDSPAAEFAKALEEAIDVGVFA